MGNDAINSTEDLDQLNFEKDLTKIRLETMPYYFYQKDIDPYISLKDLFGYCNKRIIACKFPRMSTRYTYNEVTNILTVFYKMLFGKNMYGENDECGSLDCNALIVYNNTTIGVVKTMYWDLQQDCIFFESIVRGIVKGVDVNKPGNMFATSIEIGIGYDARLNPTINEITLITDEDRATRPRIPVCKVVMSKCAKNMNAPVVNISSDCLRAMREDTLTDKENNPSDNTDFKDHRYYKYEEIIVPFIRRYTDDMIEAVPFNRMVRLSDLKEEAPTTILNLLLPDIEFLYQNPSLLPIELVDIVNGSHVYYHTNENGTVSKVNENVPVYLAFADREPIKLGDIGYIKSTGIKSIVAIRYYLDNPTGAFDTLSKYLEDYDIDGFPVIFSKIKWIAVVEKKVIVDYHYTKYQYSLIINV